MVRSLGLMAITLFCAIGIAAAQQAPSNPVSPEVLANLASKISPAPANGRMVTNQPATPLTAGGATMSGPGNLPLGFDVVHATNCAWFTPDFSNQFLFVFPEEGGFFATENNLFTAQTFLTACVAGHLIAVNIINSSTGSFNEVVTFPF